MRQDWGSEPVVNPPFMFGNNVVLKRRIYETIGGCDVRFRTHGEDADLSRRLYAAGHSTLYVPSAVVRHLRTDTMRSLLNSVWSGWRYGSMAYFNLAPPAVLRTGVSHFVGRHFTRVLSRDIRAANVPFLLFDSILPWYMLYRDLRLILRVLLKKEAGRA